MFLFFGSWYITFGTCYVSGKARCIALNSVLLFAVKEARARQIPVGLPQNLRNYFENALRKPPISNIFG